MPRTAEGGADIATIAPQHTQGATASKPVGRWNASSSARTAALELIDPARARSGASVSIPHAAQRTAPLVPLASLAPSDPGDEILGDEEAGEPEGGGAAEGEEAVAKQKEPRMRRDLLLDAVD